MNPRIHAMSLERAGETVAIVGVCVEGCGGVAAARMGTPLEVGRDSRIRGAASKLARSKALRRLASAVLRSAANAPAGQARAALAIAQKASEVARNLDREATRAPETEDEDVYE